MTSPSAVLWLDVARASAAYAAVAAAVRPIRVRYATKAIRIRRCWRRSRAAGAEFAITSLPELEALLALGIAGTRIACVTQGPPATLLRRCHAAGVRRFAVDTLWEVRKVAALAPGATVLVALHCPPAGRLRFPAAPLGAWLDALDGLLDAARGLPVEVGRRGGARWLAVRAASAVARGGRTRGRGVAAAASGRLTAAGA